MLKKTLFNNVIYKGIIGGIIGIIAGLLLGLLIWGLEYTVILIKTILTKNPYNAAEMPVEVLTMLGMGFGALIGTMNGAAAAITENKQSSKK